MFQHSRTPSPSDLADNAWTKAWKVAKSNLPEIFDLTTSNPTVVGLPAIQPAEDDLRKALNAHYSPVPQGMQTTRDAIAQYYMEVMHDCAAFKNCPMYDQKMLAAHLQLFASTSEAYGALFKLLCAPGDDVILFSPSYPLLSCLCLLDAIRTNFISFQDSAGEWEIDFYELEKAITPKTRAVVIVSPNNPTGHCISFDEMSMLEHFCASKNIALIVDEVFADFIIRPKDQSLRQPAAALAKEGLVFSLNGLSKVCGLPQHKLSWVLCGGNAERVTEALDRLSFIADATLSASTWVQLLTPGFIAQRFVFQNAIMNRILENIEFLKDFAKDKPISLDLPEAGWCICVHPGGLTDNDENTAQKLAEAGIHIFPGTFFDFPDYKNTFVISTILRPEILRAGMDRLASLIWL